MSITCGQKRADNVRRGKHLSRKKQPRGGRGGGVNWIKIKDPWNCTDLKQRIRLSMFSAGRPRLIHPLVCGPLSTEWLWAIPVLVLYTPGGGKEYIGPPAIQSNLSSTGSTRRGFFQGSPNLKKQGGADKKKSLQRAISRQARRFSQKKLLSFVGAESGFWVRTMWVKGVGGASSS